MVFVVVWLCFALIVGVIARDKGRSFFGWFLISALASPLIGGVLLIASGEGHANKSQCYACLGWVDDEASRCKHCGVRFQMPADETPLPAVPIGGYIGLTKDGRRVDL